MKIDKHTVATVTYSLRIDGELIEETSKDKPLTFLAGVGMMIPGFENQLIGKKEGDEYDITVKPSEGYGEVNEDAIIDLSKDIFKTNGEVRDDLLKIGNVVQMQDQNGNPLDGVVLEVGEEKVKMDFNHRLAGKTLNFQGEILDVREATSDEISHKHIHGPGGHEH